MGDASTLMPNVKDLTTDTCDSASSASQKHHQVVHNFNGSKQHFLTTRDQVGRRDSSASSVQLHSSVPRIVRKSTLPQHADASSQEDAHKREAPQVRSLSLRVHQAAPPEGSVRPEHTPCSVQKIHTDQKPYKCNLCPVEFVRSTHLQSHKKTHMGVRPFKCDLCPSEFTQLHHLKDHIRIHTGERPYKCVLCLAEFRHSTHLRRHKNTHTGEKPHKCNLCPAEFTHLHQCMS
ncbi:zinc finger and SCAN domain-containing protein 22-like [Ornithodoros turicata]|uniref:zinc finger and SCAN domain-containing protein 22-like n=1 Tax=Ornithodoros turicata TaxID=34597 RepID=UPI0031393441